MFKRSKPNKDTSPEPEAAVDEVTIKDLLDAGDEDGAWDLYCDKFFAALKQSKDNDFAGALKAFRVLTGEMPATWSDPTIMVKHREAVVLVKSGLWGEALSVYDDLISRPIELAGFDRERFPNEIAGLFWGRCLCLEHLGKLQEATQAIAALVEEVGAGATDTQREYLAESHLLSARFARAEARLQDALSEVDAAIATCGRFEQPRVSTTPGDARRMRKKLLAEIAEAS